MGKIVYVRATGIYDDSRATKEILALSELGKEIVVLAWNRKGDAEELCSKIFEHYPQIQFYFFDELAPGGIGIRNVDKLISWAMWVNKMLKELDDIEIIHTCNLDAGIGVLKFYKKSKVKLIYDIYDYYVDSHSIPKLLHNLVENLEISIINLADVTIICTDERKEQISKARPKQVLVIHNSPDVEEQQWTEHYYDYVYCGTLGGGRLISEILDKYEEHSDLKFVFAGYGANTVKAETLAEKFENFVFEGPIPYSRVIELEERALLISAIYKPDVRNHRLCAPNKFYEALALSKPVIVCRGTGIDKIVEENKVGIVIDYDVDAFYESIRKLKSSEKEVYEMGVKARMVYDEKYKWSVMKAKLLDCYRKL